MEKKWASQYPDNWSEISNFVKKRDDYTCQECRVRGRQYGPAELHSHHITPKSRGGSDHPTNLVTLCWRCHNSAHDHYVQPFTDRARTERVHSSVQSSGQFRKDTVRYFEDSIPDSAQDGFDSSTSDATKAPMVSRPPEEVGVLTPLIIIISFIAANAFLSEHTSFHPTDLGILGELWLLMLLVCMYILMMFPFIVLYSLMNWLE